MDTNLLKHLKCSVCLVDYDNKDHSPYVLACGHNVCQEYVTAKYNKESNTITCPECKEEN